MKICCTIILALLTLTAAAQWNFDADKISLEGKAIISRIEHDRNVPSDTMGLRFENLPKDFPLTLLREKLTIDELSELTKHDNPIVRCYGFKALTQRNEQIAFNIIADHLQDTVQISTHHGCLAREEFVGDYFIGVFSGYEAITHDTMHLNVLDSLLIFTPNKLDARHGAIRRAAEKGKYYHKIRSIALDSKLAGALISLAMFKRSEDVDIIMETNVTGAPFENHSLTTTFLAITHFPHPRFLPFLEGHLPSIMRENPHVESSFLYQAISNYNSKEAGELLARVFQITDNGLRIKHLEGLSRVLRRNTNPIYNDLRKKIAAEIEK